MDGIKIERADRKLLYYLSKNARLSYSSLAANLGISREAVRARVKRLKENGVITSFNTVFGNVHFGLDYYNLYIRFSKMDAAKQKKFGKYIKSHKSVIWSNRCLGKWDYAIILLIKDSRDMANVIDEFKEHFGGLLKDFEFDAVLYEYNFTATLPAFFKGTEIKPFIQKREDSSFFHLLEKNPTKLTRERPAVRLSRSDASLFEILSKNCRASLEEIGKKLKMTPENARYHMKKMIKKQVIGGFWAAVNYSAFGLHWYRIRLNTNRIDAKTESELSRYLGSHPSVFWAVRLLGKANIHIDVRARNNNELDDFLYEFNRRFPKLAIDYEALMMTEEPTYNNFTKKVYELAEEN